MATVGNKKALFVTLMDRVPRFEAYWSQFFAEFDWLLVLRRGLDAYISKYGDFCAHDNNDDDTTDYFTPCACTRGKYIPMSQKEGNFAECSGGLYLSLDQACQFQEIVECMI